MLTTKGLLDSGADGILINMSFAKSLNIIAKSGHKKENVGIENKPMPVYHHNIEMEICNLASSRISVNVGFIDSGSVGVLLGRRDFFENFKISFESYNGSFDIEPKP